MNFIEAENYARRRKVTLPGDYYAEAALDLRHRMFTVSGLANVGEIGHVNELFQDALKSGSSLAQFKKDMEDAGYVLPRGRFETIYRTNAQTAYNRGRLEQALRGVKRNTHPYFIYDAIDDNRTREEHRALDNLVFHIERDRERWERIYPPNGYNCRCRMRVATAREARRTMKERPVEDISSILDANTPDKGFDGVPMSTADMEEMLYGRVRELPADPAVKEAFLERYERLAAPAKVQKAVEAAAPVDGLREVLDHFDESLEIARQKMASKASRAAYNLAGSLTAREAMFVADHLMDGSALDSFLKKGGAGLSQAETARRQSALAVLTGIFDNRLSLSLPPAAPLYRTAAAGDFAAGAVIGFDSFARFYRKAPTGAETLMVLKDRFGRVLPVENLTANPAAGAALADVGEQYMVTRVLKDQYVGRKLYKRVVYLERLGRSIDESLAKMIQAGRRAWLTNGVGNG